MSQKKQISPEDQYLGVDPHNIIRMQIEIAVEALADIANSNTMSNELEMIDVMYTHGFKD